jgi:hypothetical protein
MRDAGASAGEMRLDVRRQRGAVSRGTTTALDEADGADRLRVPVLFGDAPAPGLTLQHVAHTRHHRSTGRRYG